LSPRAQNVRILLRLGSLHFTAGIVQARSAQKASEAQASLGREAAEREKTEAKAGKQL
jgi:hypothetical protein